MSEIFHQFLTGGLKANLHSDCEKFLSMLKNHPDAINVSNIPPICDVSEMQSISDHTQKSSIFKRWFLTESKAAKSIY